MTDQNMVKGDSVYPNILHVDDIPVKASLVFVKGELATINAGFLVKLTGTKRNGLVQVRNAVTGGATDGAVTVSCNIVGSRILVSLPANAAKGHFIQINGSDGVGNNVITTADIDTISLGLGRLFGLYKNSAVISTAGDLGLVDLGVI